MTSVDAGLCKIKHVWWAGVDPGEATGAIDPPKTYESNIFHHDFVQFRKTLGCQRRLDCQILLKSPPLNLRAGPAPAGEQRSLKGKYTSGKPTRGEWLISSTEQRHGCLWC